MLNFMQIVNVIIFSTNIQQDQICKFQKFDCEQFLIQPGFKLGPDIREKSLQENLGEVTVNSPKLCHFLSVKKHISHNTYYYH